MRIGKKGWKLDGFGGRCSGDGGGEGTGEEDIVRVDCLGSGTELGRLDMV